MYNRMLRNMVLLSIITAGVVALLGMLGARINTTRSIPLGLYWKTNASLGKGKYVIFCPPDTEIFKTALERGYIFAGLCPGNYGYIMKKIAASEGDKISISDQNVTVNGLEWPHSQALRTDLHGRKIKTTLSSSHTLQVGELLLMGDTSPISFDSRYYGTIQKSQVQGVIQPIVTWE